MIEICQSEVTPQFRSLFGTDPPNSHKCFGVLDGDVLGIILADNPSDPKGGLVREAGLGASFTGGKIDSLELAQTVSDLRRLGDVSFSFWPEDQENVLIPPNPDALMHDRSFKYSNRSTHVTDLKTFSSQIPDGCAIRPMDSQIMKRCI